MRDAQPAAPPWLGGHELIAASATSAIAAAVVVADLIFRPGWRVSPNGILIIAIVGGMLAAMRLRRAADWRMPDVVAFAVIVAGVASALVWMAWPEFLPRGGGPDLTHHLVLVNYIERHWQLVFDPSLVPYLGDMIYYTPGSHLLFALAGAWSRSDGLHAVQTVLAIVVALKCGFVFAVARRVLPAGPHRTTFAVAAVLLVFLPYEYVVGAFATNSFWAQIVAELFACAAWWALVAWDDHGGADAMALGALYGAAAFVTWPIWIGPIVMALVVVALSRGERSMRTTLADVTIGVAPIAIVVAIHLWGRVQWLRMAATSGAVVRPSPALVTWTFLLLAIAGAFLLAVDRRGRATIVFVAAIVAQAIALLVVARSAGADTPYMALKTLFLLPYPLAVGGAYALDAIWRLAFESTRLRRFAWIAVLLLGTVVARRVVVMPRPRPIVTEATWQAGIWARDHVDRACVDYLVADGYTGYWLHLAVLDNPRNTTRVEERTTFEPQDAVARWIDTDGLPFAIVDDVNGFSKALFTSTDTLARFGPAAVIKRHGRAICTP